jgi:hypothetical protein
MPAPLVELFPYQRKWLADNGQEIQIWFATSFRRLRGE